jgi:hypothetical protein
LGGGNENSLCPPALLQIPQTNLGIDFYAKNKRDVQKYTWNRVDTKNGSVNAQAVIITGIENRKTPTRLFFIPYTSFYYQQNELGSNKTFKAELAIKYRINGSFTLDAILVPDFSQTKFDNAILNLEPFEQIQDENRPFFYRRNQFIYHWKSVR